MSTHSNTETSASCGVASGRTTTHSKTLAVDQPMSIGHNPAVTPKQLKRIRGLMKMPQAQLAATLGVQQETVARWEIGSRGISEPTARLRVCSCPRGGGAF